MLAVWTILHLIAGLALIGGVTLASRNIAAGLLWFVGALVWIFMLAKVGHWAVIGWWWPRVLWGLLLMAAMLVLLRWRRSRPALFPVGRAGWVGLVVAAALTVSGGYLGVRIWQARDPDSITVIDVGNPFAAGQYYVASGGYDPLVNAHLETLDRRVPRYRAWRGQSLAIDCFGLGPFGLRASGLQPADPARYAIFGARVVAPCAGRVISGENRLPDMTVPERDTERKLGNNVLIRCHDAVIVLAHLQRGSVTVSPGDRVNARSPIGRVGNSGNSGEPHLHIHAQRGAPAEQPIAGEPLALRIDGRYLVRGDRLAGRR